MSKTDDSDDLEFESADENDQNDLSDLDLQEILDEDDNKSPMKAQASKIVAQEKSHQTQPKHDSSDVKEIEEKTKDLKVSDETNEPSSSTLTSSSSIPHESISKPENLEDLKTDEKIETKQDENDKKTTSSGTEVKAPESVPEASIKSDKNKIEENDDDVKQTEEESLDTIDTSWEWGAEGAKPSESLEKEKPKNETEGRLSSNMSEEKKSTKNETDSLTHNRNKPKVETTKSVEENQSSLNSDDFSAKPKEFKPSYKPEQQQHLQQQPQPQQQGGFGWSSWSKLGTNLLSSAATLTSQVIGTVEATLGAPDPEELAAKIAKAEAEQQKDATTADSNQKSSEGGWEFENDNNDWFSMDKIASTGTNLFAGSLGVLESVGKKTFEIISDKDPNLTQTREILKKVPTIGISQKPNLSQLLREAQTQNVDKTSEDSVNLASQQAKETTSPTRRKKFTFSLFFDEFKGSPNLEALEMLSSQANVKLDMLMFEKPASKYSRELKQDMNLMDELFDAKKFSGEDDDDDDDENDHDEEDGDDKNLNTTLERDLSELFCSKEKMFNLSKFESLLNSYAKTSRFITGVDKVLDAFKTTSSATRREDLPPNDLLNESIKCFALIASSIMELFHKSAESLYLEIENSKAKVKRQDVISDLKTFYSITKLAIKSVAILSDDFSKNCKQNSSRLSSENPKHVITDIYLEASNSSTFISDGFLLFSPILKFLLLKSSL